MADFAHYITHRKMLAAPSGISLSEREKEIMLLICRGHSQPEIAMALGLSEHTIKTHVTRLLSRTGTSNAVELTLFLVTFNLIDATAVKAYMHLRLQAQTPERSLNAHRHRA